MNKEGRYLCISLYFIIFIIYSFNFMFESFEYTYKTFNNFSISKIMEELNKLGQEGWELMNIHPDEIGRNRYIFKRKVVLPKSL